MVGVEAGGMGMELGQHAARFQGGSPGVLHGTYSYILQDELGQIAGTHSVSAGLDYPSVGPEHAYLRETGRVEYTFQGDEDAMDAFRLLSQLEGIIPALESAHAIACCLKMKEAAPSHLDELLVIVNLSGRGDKDVEVMRGRVE